MRLSHPQTWSWGRGETAGFPTPPPVARLSLRDSCGQADRPLAAPPEGQGFDKGASQRRAQQKRLPPTGNSTGHVGTHDSSCILQLGLRSGQLAGTIPLPLTYTVPIFADSKSATGVGINDP